MKISIYLLICILTYTSFAQNGETYTPDEKIMILNPTYQDPTPSSTTNPAQYSANIYQSTDNDNKLMKLNFNVVYLNIANNCFLNFAISTPIEKGKKQYTPISFNQIENSTYFEVAINNIFWNQNKAPLSQEFMIAHKDKKATDYEINKEAIIEPICYLKIGGKIGKNDISYADTLFNESNKTYWNYSVYLNGGVYFARIGYFGISGKYENVYNDNEETEFLIPYKNGSFISKKYSIGEPSLKEEKVLQLEYKNRINEYFGISPKFNYSLKQKKYFFEVPFYFIQNKDGGLCSGLSIGWRSDDERIYFSFFLGDIFNVYGN